MAKRKRNVEKLLDISWSHLVKLKANMKCEIENCTHRPTLNSHHIFSRRNRSTRWDTDNGICLCVGHHTMSSKFSAHGNAIAFTYWLEEYKGKDFVEKLSIKAHSTVKMTNQDKEDLLVELNNEINMLKFC